MVAYIAKMELDPTLIGVVREYLNGVEALAVAVKFDVIDLETVDALRGSSLLLAWRLWQPWIQKRRVELGRPELYSQFQVLAESLAAMRGASPNPSELGRNRTQAGSRLPSTTPISTDERADIPARQVAMATGGNTNATRSARGGFAQRQSVSPLLLSDPVWLTCAEAELAPQIPVAAAQRSSSARMTPRRTASATRLIRASL